ncbi:MAG: hypothetical protein KKA16_00250 [Alphaproteobacteria bacterium]|nr:hypothetical protein [Alphaproteobacteria bacterium]MBU2379396.1 hypothetical protein [Alphaproteobacteria bacterium]
MSEVVMLPGANGPPAKSKRLHWADTPPPNVRWLRPPPAPPMKPEATPERLLLAAMVASLRPKQWTAVIERVRAQPTGTPLDKARSYVALEIALGDFANGPSDERQI